MAKVVTHPLTSITHHITDRRQTQMGVLNITTGGSFPNRSKQFGAMDHGHAHAVAEAIRWLSEEVLPEAIERDHKLHAEGSTPRMGFDRPSRDRPGD